MNYSRNILVAVSAIIFTSSAAFAQQTPIEGISFKLGDDVQTVKNALKTNIDPEPVESNLPPSFANTNAGKSVLFLRTKGIRVFFNKKNIVETIRFEAPYAGAVGGIKIGDSEKKIKDTRGKPIKTPWQFGAAQAFQYAIDDTAYVRFDITEADGVQTIFITK